MPNPIVLSPAKVNPVDDQGTSSATTAPVPIGPMTAPGPSHEGGKSGGGASAVVLTPTPSTVVEATAAQSLAKGGTAASSWAVVSSPGLATPGFAATKSTVVESGFSSLWKALGVTPAFAAASSVPIEAPAMAIARVQMNESVAAARSGVEIALASASNWVEAVPEFSSEALASEMNAAVSAIRAALEASQAAAGDVSGITQELGELLAEIRSESVGQLAQLADISPLTWILLGIVVVVSAEIARREIRNSGGDATGAGDPDLATSWGTL